jgi:hypothetical protein
MTDNKKSNFTLRAVAFLKSNDLNHLMDKRSLPSTLSLLLEAVLLRLHCLTFVVKRTKLESHVLVQILVSLLLDMP